MEEDTISYSYQLHSARIADFILCSHQPFVRFSSMTECLPSSENREAFQAALKCDPHERFCYIDDGDDMLVGLKSISEEDSRIQADVEWWRASIVQYLEKVCAPVELGRIASLVERPIEVPRNIRLKDIINSDYAKRFCIHGPPDRLMLSKRISPDEIEESKDTWRKRIHDFLYLQPKDTTLTALGSSVTRPTNLGGSRTKLIELLQTDPEERFHLIYRSPTETVVRVKLSDSQREWLHEKWRIKAASVLLEQQRTMSLTDLGASVKRPSVHLGSTSSLRSVLTEDPQSRFILSGQGDSIRVRISADAAVPPQRTRSGSSTTTGGSPSDWNKVSRRPPRTLGSVATPILSKGSKKWHKQTTEAELDVLSARHARWNAKEPSESGASEDSTGQGVMTSPATTDLSGETSVAADSPDALFSSHASSWEWRNPLDDVMVRASLFTEATAIGSGHAAVAGQQVMTRCAPLVYGGVRPTYKEKLLPSAPKAPDASKFKAISRPAGPSSKTGGGKGSALSPYAPEYTPPGGVGAAGAAGGAGGSDSTAIAAGRGSQQRSIEEWLPTVLLGFEHELIVDFAARLQAEGFLCVRDLVMARALGQLTTEYLSAMGFKIGHCNRIFACLPMTTSG